MRRIVLLAVLGALAASLTVASVGLAAGPTRETEVVDETFHDDFLTEACGFDVTTTLKGSITRREFGGNGVLSVNTINLAGVASAGDNSFRFRDVGADVLQNAAGTLTILIIGQVPFGFHGVLKIDVATDTVVHEPHWVDTTRVCAALST
jgi:hypothetical protein